MHEWTYMMLDVALFLNCIVLIKTGTLYNKIYLFIFRTLK